MCTTVVAIITGFSLQSVIWYRICLSAMAIAAGKIPHNMGSAQPATD